MALAGIRQAVDRAVYAAARPGRTEVIVSSELADRKFIARVFTFDIVPSRNRRRLIFAGGRLLRMEFLLFSCLVARVVVEKRNRTEEMYARPIDLRAYRRRARGTGRRQRLILGTQKLEK